MVCGQNVAIHSFFGDICYVNSSLADHTILLYVHIEVLITVANLSRCQVQIAFEQLAYTFECLDLVMQVRHIFSQYLLFQIVVSYLVCYLFVLCNDIADYFRFV